MKFFHLRLFRAEEDAKRAIDEERLKEERKIALERAKEEQENRAEVMRKRDEARKVKGSCTMHRT